MSVLNQDLFAHVSALADGDGSIQEGDKVTYDKDSSRLAGSLQNAVAPFRNPVKLVWESFREFVQRSTTKGKAKTRPPMSGPAQATAALRRAFNVLSIFALLRSLVHVCVVCASVLGRFEHTEMPQFFVTLPWRCMCRQWWRR